MDVAATGIPAIGRGCPPSTAGSHRRTPTRACAERAFPRRLDLSTETKRPCTRPASAADIRIGAGLPASPLFTPAATPAPPHQPTALWRKTMTHSHTISTPTLSTPTADRRLS